MNIYFEGDIYQGVKIFNFLSPMTEHTLHGIRLYLQNFTAIPVVGRHNFTNGLEVFEGKHYDTSIEWRGNGYWIPDEFYDGPRDSMIRKRLVAMPKISDMEFFENSPVMQDVKKKIIEEIEEHNPPTSSTNSEVGSYHWFHTLVTRQRYIGEYLREKTPSEEILREWGRVLYDASRELESGFTAINFEHLLSDSKLFENKYKTT